MIDGVRPWNVKISEQWIHSDWIDLGRHFSDHVIPERTYAEMVRVANETHRNAMFVEVGTRSGGSALGALHAIRHSNRPERWLHTIDPYGMKPWRETGHEVPGFVYPDTHYREAMLALSQYAQEWQLNHCHWRMTSLDWIQTWPYISFWDDGAILGESFGFVYLDGEHTCDTVAAEMTYFAPLMVKGGVIVIDDEGLLETAGPDRDNLELLLDGGCVLSHADGQILWTTR